MVVMDDFRAIRTPEVAAAACEAVADGGLIPIATAEQRFYRTWNPNVAAATCDRLRPRCAAQEGRVNCGIQIAAETHLLIIEDPTIRTRQAS